MEKTMNIPTMNDVIDFIRKAILEDLDITIEDDYHNIKIYKNNNLKLDINLKSAANFGITSYGPTVVNGSWMLEIKKQFLNPLVIENITELDAANFRVVVLEANEYAKAKTLNYFNTFFDEEESKIKNINDLDNDDD